MQQLAERAAGSKHLCSNSYSCSTPCFYEGSSKGEAFRAGIKAWLVPPPYALLSPVSPVRFSQRL